MPEWKKLQKFEKIFKETLLKIKKGNSIFKREDNIGEAVIAIWSMLELS